MSNPSQIHTRMKQLDYKAPDDLGFKDPERIPAIQESLSSLQGEALAFFKSQTGIQDEAELKKHIVTVGSKGYKIFHYQCIRLFSFARLAISRLPAYQGVLDIARQRENAILLDVGCCFGSDIRKAVADGWPVENVVGLDLKPGFWDCGHELFKSTAKTFPAKFIAGDVFDSNIIAPHAPFYDPPLTPRPNLTTITSLSPIQGHVSVIYVSALFHLFSEEKQSELACRLGSLLSDIPGSVIFGYHGGWPHKAFINAEEHGGYTMFCHSPESWAELWDGNVFKKGCVRVQASIVENGVVNAATAELSKFKIMVWSVTRI